MGRVCRPEHRGYCGIERHPFLAGQVRGIGRSRTGSITQDDDNAPTVKLIGVDRYQASTAKESDITYRITFSITAGKENLRNIEFQIKSDITSTTFEIASLAALKTSVNVVRVKAIDSDSITGELIGYTISGPTSSVPGAPR